MATGVYGKSTDIKLEERITENSLSPPEEQLSDYSRELIRESSKNHKCIPPEKLRTRAAQLGLDPDSIPQFITDGIDISNYINQTMNSLETRDPSEWASLIESEITKLLYNRQTLQTYMVHADSQGSEKVCYKELEDVENKIATLETLLARINIKFSKNEVEMDLD